MNSHNILSAKSFVKKDEKSYEKDFNKILKLCIFAYNQMLENENDLDGKDEGKLRNLLMKHMQNNRGNYGLGNYNIDAECAENNEITNKTIGYCDLKITIPTNNDFSNEPYRYFTIECKRLDGTSQKNNLYITEGMHRFITEKYSKNMDISGMIGFIESSNNNKTTITIDNIVKNINNNLVQRFMHQQNEKLTHSLVDENFINSYESNHEIKHKKRKIKLSHLFFDNRNQGFRPFIKKVSV